MPQANGTPPGAIKGGVIAYLSLDGAAIKAGEFCSGRRLQPDAAGQGRGRLVAARGGCRLHRRHLGDGGTQEGLMERDSQAFNRA